MKKRIVCMLEIFAELIFLVLFFLAQGTGSYESGGTMVGVTEPLYETMIKLPGVSAIFGVLCVLNLLLCILSLCSFKKKRESILHVIVPVLIFIFTYWYISLCGLWNEVALSGAIYGVLIVMMVLAAAKQFLGGKKEKKHGTE